MADVTISYNGESIATMSASGTKTLLTDGKRCVDDIAVVYDKPSAPSITVEALSVTENDTYTAPSGKAYSPVTVNVPTQEATLKALIDRSITSITIPSGVTTIGENAFANCAALASITIPEGVTTINGAFSGTAISSLVVPDSCTKLGSSALYNLTNLLELTIGTGVTTFGYGACRNLTNLERLRFRAESPLTVSGSTVFQGLNSACAVLILYASTAYFSATNYPDPSTYLYLGYYASASGETLPASAGEGAYTLTWYASVADAQAQTNPITTGNGSEVYCRYAAA